jgi:hypothetical protein
MSPNVHVLRLSHVHRTTDPPAGQVCPIVESAWIAECRGKAQGPTQSDDISLAHLRERTYDIGPRRRLEGYTGFSVHGGRVTRIKRVDR